MAGIFCRGGESSICEYSLLTNLDQKSAPRHPRGMKGSDSLPRALQIHNAHFCFHERGVIETVPITEANAGPGNTSPASPH